MISPTIITLLMMLSLAVPATACIIVDYTDAEKRQQNREARANSKPVVTGANCSFVNAGLSDHLSGGPALRLENGRFYHALGTENGSVTDAMVVDCNRRAATRVIAGYKQNENYGVDSCGGEYGDRLPVLAPDGPLSLTEGADLSAFEKLAKAAKGVRVDGQMSAFFKDWMGNPVPRKDRVDFLCGCRLLYPNSAGGKS